MNSVTYSIRETNQIDLNGRDNKGRSVRKCACQSHEVWSHSSLYYLLNWKKTEGLEKLKHCLTYIKNALLKTLRQ